MEFHLYHRHSKFNKISGLQKIRELYTYFSSTVVTNVSNNVVEKFNRGTEVNQEEVKEKRSVRPHCTFRFEKFYIQSGTVTLM